MINLYDDSNQKSISFPPKDEILRNRLKTKPIVHIHSTITCNNPKSCHIGELPTSKETNLINVNFLPMPFPQ